MSLTFAKMEVFPPKSQLPSVSLKLLFLFLITMFTVWGFSPTPSFAKAIPVEFQLPPTANLETTSNFNAMGVFSTTNKFSKFILTSRLYSLISNPTPAKALGSADTEITAIDSFVLAKQFLSLPDSTPDPVIVFPENISGPSAGLMASLAYLDVLSEGKLSGGQKWVGTGEITSTGLVGTIGMPELKLEGAAAEGFTSFFIPKENLPQVQSKAAKLGITLIPVSSIDDAVQYLCDHGGTGKACIAVVARKSETTSDLAFKNTYVE